MILTFTPSFLLLVQELDRCLTSHIIPLSPVEAGFSLGSFCCLGLRPFGVWLEHTGNLDFTCQITIWNLTSLARGAPLVRTLTLNGLSCLGDYSSRPMQPYLYDLDLYICIHVFNNELTGSRSLIPTVNSPWLMWTIFLLEVSIERVSFYIGLIGQAEDHCGFSFLLTERIEFSIEAIIPPFITVWDQIKLTCSELYIIFPDYGLGLLLFLVRRSKLKVCRGL